METNMNNKHSPEGQRNNAHACRTLCSLYIPLTEQEAPLWERRFAVRDKIQCWFPSHLYATCLCLPNAPFPRRLDLPTSCLFWDLSLTTGSSSMLLLLQQIPTNPREPAQIPPLLGCLSQLGGLHRGWVVPWFTLPQAWIPVSQSLACLHLLTCLPAIWSFFPSAWPLLSPLAPRP